MSFPTDSVTLARLLANAINPLLTVLAVAAPWLDRKWSGGSAGRLRTIPYLLASAVGIGLTVVLAESGKHYSVWPGHPEFPSGHESFAAAAATCSIVRDWRWAWVAVPLALVMGWALVTAGYHHPIEVCGGVVLGATVAGTIVCLTCRKVSEAPAIEMPPATEKY